MIVFGLKFVIPAFIIIFLLRKFLSEKEYMSKSVLVLLLTSLLFNVALAQNYTFNTLPSEGRDGFAISNKLAYYVFGEDHFGHWNAQLFEKGYDTSTTITIFLLAAYIVILLIERKNSKKA